MSIKQIGLIVVLVLLLTLAAGCAEDSAGPGAEIIGEEERAMILSELEKKEIAEGDIDWELTGRILEFEEVVWCYFEIQEAEVNGFVAYVSGLEAEDYRRFIPEIQEIAEDAYPGHDVTIGGKEVR